MRKLSNYLSILVLGVLFSSFTSNTNNSFLNADVELVSVFETSTFSFNIQSNMSEEIVNTTYHEDSDDFQLSTLKVLKFIQVFNQKGDLEYQLPVETTELHLNVNDFKSGTNNIALMFNNTPELTFATLEKK